MCTLRPTPPCHPAVPPEVLHMPEALPQVCSQLLCQGSGSCSGHYLPPDGIVVTTVLTPPTHPAVPPLGPARVRDSHSAIPQICQRQ